MKVISKQEQKEYIFHHHRGEFTGILLDQVGNLMKVKLTSKKKGCLDRQNQHSYQEGEIAYINVETRKTEI